MSAGSRAPCSRGQHERFRPVALVLTIVATFAVWLSMYSSSHQSPSQTFIGSLMRSDGTFAIVTCRRDGIAHIVVNSGNVQRAGGVVWEAKVSTGSASSAMVPLSAHVPGYAVSTVDEFTSKNSVVTRVVGGNGLSLSPTFFALTAEGHQPGMVLAADGVIRTLNEFMAQPECG